jgi:hypothetical protein
VIKLYVYILRLRPPGPGCQPMDGLVKVSTEQVPFHGRHSWGTALYNRQLTKEEEEHYDMEYLGMMEDEFE